jgi:hypothetical protein
MQDANFSSGPEEAPSDGQVSVFAFDLIYLSLHESSDAGEATQEMARERWEIARLKMRRPRAAYERIDREGV